MERVLITGGGGYLGSKLAERLSSQVSSLYLIDLKFNELSQELVRAHEHVSSIHCDIRDYESVHVCMNVADPDTIFHLAALLNRERDFDNYERLYEVNVMGTLNLLRAVQGGSTTRFVFTSSSEVYGNGNSPFSEDQVTCPASPYSLTKLMAEKLIRTFATMYDIPFTILRLFNFYGDDMPEDFFLSQLKNSLQRNEEFRMTKGEQVRDYLEVHEVINYVIGIAQTETSKNETVNICSGIGRKLSDLAMSEAKHQCKESLVKIGALPYRNNEVWEMVGDSSKLEALSNSGACKLIIMDKT